MVFEIRIRHYIPFNSNILLCSLTYKYILYIIAIPESISVKRNIFVSSGFYV